MLNAAVEDGHAFLRAYYQESTEPEHADGPFVMFIENIRFIETQGHPIVWMKRKIRPGRLRKRKTFHVKWKS